MAVYTVNIGETLSVSVSGLTYQNGLAVPDAAPGVSLWVAVSEAGLGIPLIERQVALSSYTQASGISFHVLTAAESAGLSRDKVYQYSIRATEGTTVTDIETGQILMQQQPSIRTTAPTAP